MATKDACYRKVKARYKVFPSAYASGAIAKCRKVGAKNWGKSKVKEQITKKENTESTEKTEVKNKTNIQPEPKKESSEEKK